MVEEVLDLQSVDDSLFEQTWEFESDDAQWMLDYWQTTRSDRPRPAWSDIDLLKVYDHARAMTVKDAVNGGEDFLVRFWGTELAEFLEYDATGKLLSEYYPKSDVASILDTHRLALFGDIPVRRCGNSRYPERGMAKFEMIHLPLDNDAGEPSHVITLTTFKWAKNKS